MQAFEAIYDNGTITFKGKPIEGIFDVLVILPVSDDDPWERILADKTPRPALAKLVEQARREMEEGKTTPLDLDRL
jgi:hypothetical protein